MNETIIKKLYLSGKPNQRTLASLKRQLAKKDKKPLPTNPDLLQTYHKLVKNKSINKNPFLEQLLKTSPVRSLSGIVSVSVLTKPYPCPGKCLYCPNQKGLPKSYLRNEPAVERALANNFNPYRQTYTRLESLKATGHPTAKIELIILGGTWSFLPNKYQKYFVKECFRAANEYGKKSTNKKRNKNKQSLEFSQKTNEKAKNRIIGITIETRPDFINQDEIIRLRKLGVTKVELGVQSLNDRVLKINCRGHNVKKTIEATKLLKDAGLKVGYHLMPNLPGASIKTDQKTFIQTFSNFNFRPDFLKIYPCAVLKEAPLYKIWQKGGYRPYSEKQLTNLLIFGKQQAPAYCRIQRLIRDIPSGQIIAGSKTSNLRQILAKEMAKRGLMCQCVRCREIKGDYGLKENLFLVRRNYPASSGTEIFLSFENKKQEKLYALLRLRIPDFKEKPFFSALENSAIIREVHTYGQTTPLKTKTKTSPQHKGLGLKLIKEAEKITKKEFGLNKIAVISGIGARDYYRRKAGYRPKNGYMTKKL